MTLVTIGDVFERERRARMAFALRRLRIFCRRKGCRLRRSGDIVAADNGELVAHAYLDTIEITQAADGSGDINIKIETVKPLRGIHVSVTIDDDKAIK